MNSQRSIRTLLLLAAGLLVPGAGGCYTVLLNSTSGSSDQVAAESYSGAGSDIQYSSDCRSCHSDAELADRSYDMKMADLRVVHGISVDPYGWDYHYRPEPWWAPTTVAGGTASAVSGTTVKTGSASRTRSEGDSRGRAVNAAAAPTSQGQAPASPPGAAPASGSTASEQPGSVRPRQETKSGGTRARTDGSTRGERK